MKFKYSKFQGFDVFGINLGELMDSMSDALLDSGYDDDYYWTRQRKTTDTSLDALRRALLQALMNQGLVNENQIREMLAQNEGKFRGSLLEELLNQLIERLVDKRGKAGVKGQSIQSGITRKWRFSGCPARPSMPRGKG